MKLLSSTLLALHIFSWSATGQATEMLPRLNIDREQITVSGLSSGAFMANQLLVAYSATVKGAALFAGGPYYCSTGSLARAITSCMNSPATIDIEPLAQYATEMESKGLIDSLRNLSQARLYIFSSPIDSVVRGESGKQIHLLMKKWIPEKAMALVITPKAEHGIPTLNYGNPCAQRGSPFLQNCQMDGVGLALQHLYKNQLLPPRDLSKEEKSGLTPFDQIKVADANASLMTEGWIFTPPSCKQGAKCRLHVAFHGCSQNSSFVGMQFIENAGYLPWAISNNIVVLFPQALGSQQNPKGCWDWFGYTGPQFATKEGPQMKAIKTMIAMITGP